MANFYKLFIWFGVLLVLWGKAQGQNQSVPSGINVLLRTDSVMISVAVADSITAYMRADTVRAVKSLFRRQRSAGRVVLYIAAAGLATTVVLVPIAIAAGTSNFIVTSVGGTPQRHGYGWALLGSAVGTGILGGAGITSKNRFSAQEEQRILAQYAQGQPLPEPIAKRLLPLHFKTKK